ncbi:Armadillo repeat-containing protein 6, partial [Tetrabaena socialis]
VEETKCRLVEGGAVATILQLLAHPEAPLDLIGPACGVVRSVTTADDERPPSSKAFMHARVLAKSHAAIRVLLGVLRRVPVAEQPDTAVRVLNTVRTVAANEEICREFTDDGGVRACLAVLRECGAHREVCRACLGALRQLAHSDTVKRLLAGSGAIEEAMRAIELHAGSEEVAEVALGLLGNMFLRHPEVRLMTARNPELRPAYLDRGAEALLRAAKVACPSSCKDVGAAALRDLGLEHYNDGEF